MANSLDPDQTPHLVLHDLGPNCLVQLAKLSFLMGNYIFSGKYNRIEQQIVWTQIWPNI